MGNPLDIRRTAAEWAAAGEHVEIKEKIGDFKQFAAIVEADLAVLESDEVPARWRDAGVAGTLDFAYVDGDVALPAVECRVVADVDAVCQRCLTPFRLRLEVESRLLFLDMDQTVDGYDDLEVWELAEAAVRPREIVEELLIMAMPYSAMHTESAACKALSPTGDDGEKTTRPFAALREQMMQEQ